VRLSQELGQPQEIAAACKMMKRASMLPKSGTEVC
jgi:hypothetical protein